MLDFVGSIQVVKVEDDVVKLQVVGSSYKVDWQVPIDLVGIDC